MVTLDEIVAGNGRRPTPEFAAKVLSFLRQPVEPLTQMELGMLITRIQAGLKNGYPPLVCFRNAYQYALDAIKAVPQDSLKRDEQLAVAQSDAGSICRLAMEHYYGRMKRTIVYSDAVNYKAATIVWAQRCLTHEEKAITLFGDENASTGYCAGNAANAARLLGKCAEDKHYYEMAFRYFAKGARLLNTHDPKQSAHFFENAGVVRAKSARLLQYEDPEKSMRYAREALQYLDVFLAFVASGHRDATKIKQVAIDHARMRRKQMIDLQGRPVGRVLEAIDECYD